LSWRIILSRVEGSVCAYLLAASHEFLRAGSHARGKLAPGTPLDGLERSTVQESLDSFLYGLRPRAGHVPLRV